MVPTANGLSDVYERAEDEFLHGGAPGLDVCGRLPQGYEPKPAFTVSYVPAVVSPMLATMPMTRTAISTSNTPYSARLAPLSPRTVIRAHSRSRKLRRDECGGGCAAV